MYEFSVIIPTKNRWSDLKLTLDSLKIQLLCPNEVIIVDQSSDCSTERLVDSFREVLNTKVLYFHEKHIQGLIEAKKFGVSKSSCPIVCFLEDDVILDGGYFEELLRELSNDDSIIGCSGIITNTPNRSELIFIVNNLLFRGDFKDFRIDIFSGRKGQGLHRNRCLSGGLSAWRSYVFEAVPFDVENNLFMVEDIDFSYLVADYFGNNLFINTRARLSHSWSEVNRDSLFPRNKRKIREFICFYKKRRMVGAGKCGFFLALLWFFGAALNESIKNRSLTPLSGYFVGFWAGIRTKII